MTPADLGPVIALLQRLAEQARPSGAVVPDDLKAEWSRLERQLLLGLRVEERAVSLGADPVRALRAVGANERIRNLVWEVSVSLDLQSPRPIAMLELAELLGDRESPHSPERDAAARADLQVSPDGWYFTRAS
jgi:hypothetical protein